MEDIFYLQDALYFKTGGNNMKKFFILTAFVLLLSGLLVQFTYAASTPDLGKKVNWVNISSDKSYFLNGSEVTFSSKKKNAYLVSGLDKRIKYFTSHVEDTTGKYNFTAYSEATYYSSGHLVRFEPKQKTKKVYAMIVFYDKDKKAIGHQEQVLTLKKLEVSLNKNIKMLPNKNIIQVDKKSKNVVMDLKKVKGAYASLHASLKPLTVQNALAQEQSLVTTGWMPRYNPWYKLPVEDYSWKPKEGKLFTMLIIYDKNLKPISYISLALNSADF
jgi:hypothetical protein